MEIAIIYALTNLTVLGLFFYHLPYDEKINERNANFDIYADQDTLESIVYDEMSKKWRRIHS